METLKENYITKVKSSPHLWKNKTGIERGINLFRDNVIKEFIKLNDYNLSASFELFARETGFWHIYTKEDFEDQLLDYYDEFGECDYFDSDLDEFNIGYKNTIRDLWADGCYNLSSMKILLKEYNKCDTLHMDGVLDNILHQSSIFIDYLPSAKQLNRYDVYKMDLIREDVVMKYLKRYERGK
jgi:hypothetical protein